MAISIIAELCQNHLGDNSLLEKMVDEALSAGATHVKIQHIHTSNLTFRPQFEEGLAYDRKIYAIKRPFQVEYDRLKPLELSPDYCESFVSYVKSKGAIPVTTCFARGDIRAIRDQGFEVVKVASYDCASYQMLRELAENFQELIISTGATYMDEIIKAAQELRHYANYSFLHCVTVYPTPLEQMNLSRIALLKPHCLRVGFSDHSLVSRDGLVASKAAMLFGSEIIERHFTILDSDKTKDGPVSIKPEQLKELVRFSNLSKAEQQSELDNEHPDWHEKLKGTPSRNLSEVELLNRDYYRGRFATPRCPGVHSASTMINNWEETPI
jgi:N,N'-diacetyllegionaminate synthase